MINGLKGVAVLESSDCIFFAIGAGDEAIFVTIADQF